VLDASLPFAAKEIETETILRWIGRGDESGAESDPLRRVDHALEDRVLHALTAIFAEPRYTPKPPPSGVIPSAYVIADKYEHGRRLSPEECRIGVQSAANKPSQQQRLNIGNEADGNTLTEERMLDLFLLAHLP
jgi:hypothetical protein